jgi:hypothetical protein
MMRSLAIARKTLARDSRPTVTLVVMGIMATITSARILMEDKFCRKYTY